MSLVLAIVSRERAFLMSDGISVHPTTWAVQREDFEKIFRLQNGNRVAIVGGPLVIALARSLQKLPPSVSTLTVAEAIRDWTKAHPSENACITLVGRNGDALYFQHAELVHERGQAVWDFTTDDFTENRLRAVWSGYLRGEEVTELACRVAHGISFEDAVSEGRELFKVTHRSFPGKVGGKKFEDHMTLDAAPDAEDASSAPVCESSAPANVIPNSFGVGIVAGFVAGQYSQTLGPTHLSPSFPNLHLTAGSHMSMSPDGALQPGWDAFTWAIACVADDQYLIILTHPSGTVVGPTAQQNFTCRFWT